MKSDLRVPKKKRVAPSRAVALPKGYAQLVERIKARILTAQARAAMAANQELLRLYWAIGRDLVGEQRRSAYGSRVVERLSTDLNTSFPGVHGLSAPNLWRMRAFFLAFPPDQVLPQLVAEPPEPTLPQAVALLPWAHHVLLLERVNFAFLEVPDSDRTARRKELAKAGIHPIWYPVRAHDESIEALLMKLAGEI